MLCRLILKYRNIQVTCCVCYYIIEELLGSVAGLGLGVYVGVNLIGVPDKIGRDFEYYFTYLGRHLVYRTANRINQAINKTK